MAASASQYVWRGSETQARQLLSGRAVWMGDVKCKAVTGCESETEKGSKEGKYMLREA